MATKLLAPPIIEGKLPAQAKGAGKIVFPFQPNPSVGENMYKGFVVKIKTIVTNTVVATLYNDSPANKQIADFTLPAGILSVGQFYKAQLAYKDVSDIVGNFSTVGVFKYTGDPAVKINVGGDVVSGQYTAPTEDITERPYSYCFNIYDGSVLVETSGVLPHSAFNETNTYIASDTYQLNKIFSGFNYEVECVVTTVNGLVVTSARVPLNQTLSQNLQIAISASSNFNTGSCTLRFDDPGIDYKVVRLSSKDNYNTFDVLAEFTKGATGQPRTYYDRTLEQGYSYKYWILSNSGSYAESNTIFADFEDVFLYDGELQLKIRFNPKVTSFKDTLQESKLDTIGGQFPFIFRNGRLKYKEFSIGGLISYWMDEEGLFMPLSFGSSSRPDTPSTSSSGGNVRSTDQTSTNIALERQFKLKVLEWLNNGQPKLFRSPTEGNYIVRLMGVSLSPEETLGGMIHSFSANACEVAEYNVANLKTCGFTRG